MNPAGVQFRNDVAASFPVRWRSPAEIEFPGCFRAASEELDYVTRLHSAAKSKRLCTTGSTSVTRFATTIHGMAKSKMKTTTTAERLEKIMDAMGWDTKIQLASAAGATKQVCNHWFKRGTKIAPEYAFRLQNITHFNARWICLGEGAERVTELTTSEAEFLEKFREMSPRRQRALFDVL